MLSYDLFNEISDLLWPEINMKLIEEKENDLPIQIKGKLISTINTKKGYNEKDLLEQIYKLKRLIVKLLEKRLSE